MYACEDGVTGLHGFWSNGDWAIQPQFSNAHNFVNGLAAVDLEDGRRAFLRLDHSLHLLEEICGGRKPIPTNWTEPDCFCFTGFDHFHSHPDRYEVVRTESLGRREWGLVDTRLNYISLPAEVFDKIESIQPYGEYLIIRRKTDRIHESAMGLFNIRSMELEIPLGENSIHPSLEPIWVISKGWYSQKQHETLRFAFYDVSKREVISDWFEYAFPFSEGFGAFRGDDDLMSVVDQRLRPVFDTRFDEVERFSYGLAAAYDEEDSFYIDTKGQMRLLLPHYERLGPFNEFGYAIANRDEAKWDLDIIDRSGQAQLEGFETAVFWEGDFPYFEVTKDEETLRFDEKLNPID